MSHSCREYFGNMNFFGGPSPVSVKASSKLRQIEQENEDAMIVFLSDVWLDDPKVWGHCVNRDMWVHYGNWGLIFFHTQLVGLKSVEERIELI
jgi:hypothetical protein